MTDTDIQVTNDEFKAKRPFKWFKLLCAIPAVVAAASCMALAAESGTFNAWAIVGMSWA